MQLSSVRWRARVHYSFLVVVSPFSTRWRHKKLQSFLLFCGLKFQNLPQLQTLMFFYHWKKNNWHLTLSKKIGQILYIISLQILCAKWTKQIQLFWKPLKVWISFTLLNNHQFFFFCRHPRPTRFLCSRLQFRSFNSFVCGASDFTGSLQIGQTFLQGKQRWRKHHHRFWFVDKAINKKIRESVNQFFYFVSPCG